MNANNENTPTITSGTLKSLPFDSLEAPLEWLMGQTHGKELKDLTPEEMKLEIDRLRELRTSQQVALSLKRQPKEKGSEEKPKATKRQSTNDLLEGLFD